MTVTTLEQPAMPGEPDAKLLAKDLMRYREPSNGRALFEIAVTLVPFAALWLAMWALLDVSYGFALVLAVPAAGFLVRLFMIQHDCGHGSFFSSRAANNWVGRTSGVLTFTPYGLWQHTHALHHASSGNLDKRGFGDIDTLTVEEYRARSRWGRLKYRLYRHPFVMFGFGPAYLFLIQHRLPVGLMRSGWKPWASTMGTNLAIAAVAVLLIWLTGLKAFLLIQIPVIIIAASIGVWLFYVQHQFEDTNWDHNEDWNRHEAALHGSSHYDLPPVIRWFTANIGLHHIHHLCSRIPYYRLTQVLKDHPALNDVGKLGFLESLSCVRLTLWDEKKRRLISFRHAHAHALA